MIPTTPMRESTLHSTAARKTNGTESLFRKTTCIGREEEVYLT